MELSSVEKKRLFVYVGKKIRNQLDNLSLHKERANVAGVYSKMSKENSKINLVDTSKVPTFSKLVKEHMKNKELTTKDIYKNSLIDRKLFSALNVNDYYCPSKETAIMYCFALKLSSNEAMDLLKSAGYVLYEYSNFDIIIKYFLDNNIYNINKLNDTLYFYTKKCIGYR